MKYPIITRAQDLPTLHAWLIDFWNSEHAAIAYPPDAVPMRRALQSPDLWWVDRQACELLAAAVETFPGDVCNSEHDLPRPSSGLAVFEQPLRGDDAVTEGNTVEVAAVLWSPGLYRPDNGDCTPALAAAATRTCCSSLDPRAARATP